MIAAPARNPLRLTMGQAFLPILHNIDPFILVESPRGCLKTCTILDILMMRACKWPGLRWYIWRSTSDLLADTILESSFEPYILPKWSKVPGMRCVNPGARPSNRVEYLFENGSSIVPMGIGDMQKGTSREGAGGYLAEAVELEFKEKALVLSAMMRQPGVPFNQIIVDCNPSAPDHWLNQIAEPIASHLRWVHTREDYDRLQEYNRRPAVNPTDKWKRIVAKIQDNPFYFDLENWKIRERGQRYLEKNLAPYTGHLRDRWVHGLWKAAEGSVYPNFHDEHNVWPTPPTPDGEASWLPTSWPLYWGIDPGMDHPAAILWMTVTPSGQIIVIEEIVVSGKGTDELVPMVKAIEQRNGWTNRVISRYGDPQYSFSSTAMSKRTIAEQWRDLGINLHPWPRTGDNMDGMVDAVRTLINTRKLIITANCPKTIAAVQSWSFKRNRDGTPSGAKGKDAYEEGYKDANDVIRGIVALNPRYGRERSEVHG